MASSAPHLTLDTARFLWRSDGAVADSEEAAKALGVSSAASAAAYAFVSLPRAREWLRQACALSPTELASLAPRVDLLSLKIAMPHMYRIDDDQNSEEEPHVAIRGANSVEHDVDDCVAQRRLTAAPVPVTDPPLSSPSSVDESHSDASARSARSAASPPSAPFSEKRTASSALATPAPTRLALSRAINSPSASMAMQQTPQPAPAATLRASATTGARRGRASRETSTSLPSIDAAEGSTASGDVQSVVRTEIERALGDMKRELRSEWGSGLQQEVRSCC